MRKLSECCVDERKYSAWKGGPMGPMGAVTLEGGKGVMQTPRIIYARDVHLCLCVCA